MALFLVSAGLKCVDDNGCLREHCLPFFEKFQPQYQILIRNSMANNQFCRVTLPTATN
jgi:hypothetical protein